MTQWEGNRGSISNDPEYVNGLAHTDAPWAEGTDHNIIDKLLWDVVNQGLVEEDPTTTDWESSKERLGNGEIAVMSLGSWAIVQMEQAAASPEDIGYMPFPHQIDGVYYSTASGDYKIGINKNSGNKEAARAWLDFFVNESNYAFDQGGISPRLDGENPAQLSGFDDLGVQFTEIAPEPAGEEGLTSNIDSEAEIGLFDPIYRQRIVDAARGQASETLDDIFADLNSRWAAARAELGAD
jgi:ABC-type glycerol-3-phosphate transport system substrate-binding protein